jgi:hypothetical protein
MLVCHPNGKTHSEGVSELLSEVRGSDKRSEKIRFRLEKSS